ncbi:MAG: hypothetical protein ACLP8S_02190 [Solirubrobacteraceae bacterium]
MPDRFRFAVERSWDDDQTLDAAGPDRRQAAADFARGPGERESVDEVVLQLLRECCTGLAMARWLVAGGGL